MDAIALAKKRGQRLLQVLIGGLAALATLMLGLGQGDLLMPLGMTLAVVVSLWLTDITGYFQLPRTAANLIALGAVLWILKDLRQWFGVGQVLVIAKLLVYLQAILLFQRKDARAYWQLAMISLLQVVVAAAFQQGVLFGLLLMIYFLLALWTMILFFLYREWEQYDRSGGMSLWARQVWRRLETFPPLKKLLRAFSSQRAPSGAVAAGDGSTAQADHSASLSEDTPQSPSVSRPVVVRRWPLAGQPSTLQGGVAPTAAGLGWSMAGPIAKIALATWTLTLLLFFVIPRTGAGSWRGVAFSLRSAVGFTDQVTLGELGRIIQKNDEVLRIRFSDSEGLPYFVDGPLYLRGALLHHYQDGQWRFARYPRPPLAAPLRMYPLPPYRPLIRQQITIEPMDRQELFCLWPFAAVESDPSLFVDVVRHRLLRPEEVCRERFSYTLWTTALEQGVQDPLNPAPFPQDIQELLQLPRREGQIAVPSLKALAQQWVQQAGLPPENRMNIARLLEARLKFSGRFKYSLQGQPRNPELDPVEDFLTEHPAGHCEYFATALALMLRSVGIPSRVVVGYLCDEWNPAGQFFQVRQWHAHMWVEAYLERRHLPDFLTTGPHRSVWASGAWLRLDPTPQADPLQDQPFYMRWLYKVHTVWANYVLELDRFRQTETIYKPIQEALRTIADRVQDPAWWAGLVSEAWQWLQRFFAEWRRSGWFSWQGFVVSFLLGLVLGGLILLLQKLNRRLRQQVAEKHASRQGRRIVEFYQRMETLFQAHGLRRLPGQTPLEFALQAGAVLADRLQAPQWRPLPVLVVDAFYRVRFGAQELDAVQTQQVEHTLDRLKKALADYRASAAGKNLLNVWREKIGAVFRKSAEKDQFPAQNP